MRRRRVCQDPMVTDASLGEEIGKLEPMLRSILNKLVERGLLNLFLLTHA